VRLSEPRLGGLPAVTRESRRAITGHGADDPGFGLDPTDKVVLHLDEVHVIFIVEAHFVRLIAERAIGWPAVRGVPPLCRPAAGGDEAGPLVNAANAVVLHRADVERTVGADRQPEGLGKPRLVRRSAVSRVRLAAVPRDGANVGGANRCRTLEKLNT